MSAFLLRSISSSTASSPPRSSFFFLERTYQFDPQPLKILSSLILRISIGGSVDLTVLLQILSTRTMNLIYFCRLLQISHSTRTVQPRKPGRITAADLSHIWSRKGKRSGTKVGATNSRDPCHLFVAKSHPRRQPILSSSPSIHNSEDHGWLQHE